MDDLPRVNGELARKFNSAGQISGTDNVPYTIEAAIADAERWLSGDPTPNSASGVQYWIWTGHRLVRASPEVDERLRRQEAREQAELQLLHAVQKVYRQRRCQSYRRIAGRVAAPLRRIILSWRPRIHDR